MLLIGFLVLVNYLTLKGFLFTKNIFVSAEDSFGFVLNSKYEVRGPAKRNYECMNTQRYDKNCKTFNEYEVRNKSGDKTDYIILAVYPEKIDIKDKDFLEINGKTITFTVGESAYLLDELKESLSLVKKVNMEDCYCDICSASCKKITEEQIFCGIPLEDNFRYCRENYCVAEKDSCKSVSYNELKKDYLLNNFLKIIRSNN